MERGERKERRTKSEEKRGKWREETRMRRAERKVIKIEERREK